MNLPDHVKEQIRFNTEIIKLIFVLFLTTGGSTITLIVNDITGGVEVVFTIGGMIVAITCIKLLYSRYRITQKLITSGKP